MVGVTGFDSPSVHMSQTDSDADRNLPPDLEADVRAVAAEAADQRLDELEVTDRNGDSFSVSDLVNVGLTRRQAIGALGLAMFTGATLTEAAIRAFAGRAKAATGLGEVGTQTDPLSVVYVNDIGDGSEPVQSINNGDYHETVVTGTVSGTTSLDLSAANVFRHTLTGNTTFEFNNPSSSPAGNSFTLIVQQDGTGGHSVSWPSSVQWDSGSAPSLSTSANDKHVLGFISPDGGSTWIGVLSATGVA